MWKALYVDTPCKQLLYWMGEDFSVVNFAQVTHSGIRLGLKSFHFQEKIASSVAYVHYSNGTFSHLFRENLFMKTG